jgi:5-methylcytosine-specific restriction endonuclease McrA
MCKQKGIWAFATLVDHIIPLPEGPRLLLENLQPLCDSCHAEKTANDLRNKRAG